ncbi:MAG: hypothetical protein AAGC79_10215 [Pseudomonadota bacterium]
MIDEANVEQGLASFFIGHFEHRLDDKGRCSLPSDFRDILREQNSEGSFVLIPPYGVRPCHFAVSRTGLARIIKALPEREFASPGELEATRRHFTTRAKLITYEPNGRFILGLAQREAFRLPKGGDLVFAGYGTTFEIWSKPDYEQNLPGPEVEPAPIDPWEL